MYFKKSDWKFGSGAAHAAKMVLMEMYKDAFVNDTRCVKSKYNAAN